MRLSARILLTVVREDATTEALLAALPARAERVGDGNIWLHFEDMDVREAKAAIADGLDRLAVADFQTNYWF